MTNFLRSRQSYKATWNSTHILLFRLCVQIVAKNRPCFFVHNTHSFKRSKQAWVFSPLDCQQISLFLGLLSCAQSECLGLEGKKKMRASYYVCEIGNI